MSVPAKRGKRDHAEEVYGTPVTTLVLGCARSLAPPDRGDAGPGYPISRETFGPGLSSEDSRLLFESVARLNGAEPSQGGRPETWSNPQTKSHGTFTIIRVFHSGGMACHLHTNEFYRLDLFVKGGTPAFPSAKVSVTIITRVEGLVTDRDVPRGHRSLRSRAALPTPAAAAG